MKRLRFDRDSKEIGNLTRPRVHTTLIGVTEDSIILFDINFGDVKTGKKTK